MIGNFFKIKLMLHKKYNNLWTFPYRNFLSFIGGKLKESKVNKTGGVVNEKNLVDSIVAWF